MASHHKEKRGGGGQGNLLEECIQQNHRTEIASPGAWRDTAGRCQETRLRVLSWDPGSQPGARKARERQGPTEKKIKNGARTCMGGRGGRGEAAKEPGTPHLELV